MKKVVIAGSPASGKTTLAHKIKDMFGIPIYYLDKIFWTEPKGISQEEFLNEQIKIINQDAWLLDGGFVRSQSFDIRLQNADTIIIFDLPKPLIIWRLLKRYFQFLGKKRPDMPERHNENLSIVWHVIKYVFNYPKGVMYEKLEKFRDGKQVFVIKNREDEKNIMNLLK